MTEAEFIAWFEGYTGRLKGRPNQKDWDEIVAKVGALEDRAPLKAWFSGLRVKIKKLPSEREWSAIQRHVGEEAAKGVAKGGRLRGLFETFEDKACAMRDAPNKKSGR
jgi:hypothetical protein